MTLLSDLFNNLGLGLKFDNSAFHRTFYRVFMSEPCNTTSLVCFRHFDQHQATANVKPTPKGPQVTQIIEACREAGTPNLCDVISVLDDDSVELLLLLLLSSMFSIFCLFNQLRSTRDMVIVASPVWGAPNQPWKLGSAMCLPLSELIWNLITILTCCGRQMITMWCLIMRRMTWIGLSSRCVSNDLSTGVLR